ncbi:sulfurtransferase [Rubrobacter aplysinae]|uniref:sulfurtransferase n=1 Tax=Rubrobacter aplysinae TaxID=909625 RepID=UPI00064C0A84|nr:sulfurtransferase [Rubrobacter aplysinae]
MDNPQQNDPLVSTSWLAEHLDDPDLRVVDIRGYVDKHTREDGSQEAIYRGAPEEYAEAHVPGAVFVDWTTDITDPDDPVPTQLAPPERFAAAMQSRGIGDSTRVVIYDHTGGQFATRLWWALLYYGHDETYVLDGGWRKWTAEARPVTDEISRPVPANFTLEPRPGLRSGAAEALVASEDGNTLLLDARDRGQFTGEVRRGPRGGHIPGARHLHADALKDPETGTFLARAEIEQLAREAGVPEDRDAPVVAYCNGGVAATVALFNLYRLGYTNLSNYDGSWNEWGGRGDLPVESGGDP